MVTEAHGLSQRLEGKYLFSFLLQLLCLHALLYLREQGCAGCVEVLETFLLAELLHLALQLPVGQPHLLELQLALVQLVKKIKESENINGGGKDWINLLVCEGVGGEE